MREAAKIAVKTVCKTLTSLSKVKMVQFVLYDFNTYKIFEEVLKEVENDD